MRVTATLLAVAFASPAAAIPRVEVMDRGRALAFHPWTCHSSNLSASCTSGYESSYVPGHHMGLPYDWGGFVSLHQFKSDIENGAGAGSVSSDGVLSCTTGLDCSGFVSECWDLAYKRGTSTLGDSSLTHAITSSEIRPGDIYNDANHHVVMHDLVLSDGSLVYLEANPPNTHLNGYASWAGVEGYVTLRYNEIEETGSDLGTFSNPIEIDTFPFIDATRDTRSAPSDLLDACGMSPTTDESGREYIYSFTVSSPGTLTASVSCDAGTDVDIHLYTEANEDDCMARHHQAIELELTACGTYYLVVDTWVSPAGDEMAGPYSLSVEFTPTDDACQAMPEYDFLGGPGDACAAPGHPNLPYCNPNLGALICLYGDTDSFCSWPCSSANDCAEGFPGGCCADVGIDFPVCLPHAYCQTTPPTDGGPTDGGMTTLPPVTTPGGDADDADDTDSAEGCACVSATTGWGALALIPVFLLRRRRR